MEINKIYQGDCLELMKQIDDKSVDMILCDLPYGTTQCKWDSIIPFDMLWIQYKRIIKDEGVIVLTASQPFSSALIMSNPKMFKYDIIWEKSKATGFLNSKKRPLVAHEHILIFYKKQSVYNPQMSEGKPYNKGLRKQQTDNDVYNNFNQKVIKNDDGLRYPRSVKYFKTSESEGEVLHKTQKPLSLGRYLIRTYTNEGDLVLDNACGVGSFPLSAKMEDRKFIGIELDKGYVEIANKRLKNFSREQS